MCGGRDGERVQLHPLRGVLGALGTGGGGEVMVRKRFPEAVRLGRRACTGPSDAVMLPTAALGRLPSQHARGQRWGRKQKRRVGKHFQDEERTQNRGYSGVDLVIAAAFLGDRHLRIINSRGLGFCTEAEVEGAGGRESG